MKKCKYCKTEYRFLHTCKGKRNDPEKLRKLTLLSSGILAVTFLAIVFLFYYAIFNTLKPMAEYGLEQLAEIKAAKNLTFPLNETRRATAMSELSLVWSFFVPPPDLHGDSLHALRVSGRLLHQCLYPGMAQDPQPQGASKTLGELEETRQAYQGG